MDMKKFALYGTLLFFSALFLQACGSARSAAEKEQRAADIRKAVEMSDFIFKATYAYPTGYRSVYLSPYYEVKVSPDTVRAYLPFYGRAYRAPMDPREGGYHFTSTDFTYKFTPGDRKGNWIAEVTFLDLDRPVTFRFDIWEDGNARLNVNDMNRQPISFQGDIEIKKEEE
jgi:hypothetical protein